ncbi:MAG: hypothetical protein AB8G11_08440 [Saprospiraceae bacterium]
MKNLSIFVLGLLFLASCNTDPTVENLSIDYGYDYYPVELGKYIIYDVDSVVYDPIQNGTFIDTTSYQAKEEIVDTTIDNAGRTMFIIHYSTRDSVNQPWTLENVYTTVVDDFWVERTEDNLRFVKMLFPSRVDSTWDGNRLFVEEDFIVTVRGETLEMFKNWSSVIKEKSSSGTIGGLNFDDILTVQHADDENLIERRFVEEKYARGVGLVSKTMMILDTQCGGNLSDCVDLTWEEKAEKGFILTMTINEYN